jgi:hypothetical protein
MSEKEVLKEGSEVDQAADLKADIDSKDQQADIDSKDQQADIDSKDQQADCGKIDSNTQQANCGGKKLCKKLCCYGHVCWCCLLSLCTF